MKQTDIAIIDSGLAGSTAAAMLGRAGIAAILLDPHAVYPPNFRIEKLHGGEQVDRLRRTGIADAVLRQATLDGEHWIARFGLLLDKAPSRQYGIAYDTLVNAIRAEIPPSVERIVAKAVAITAGDDRQHVALSNDETISARLVVLANGLNVRLRRMLGITREIESPCHSISIGFDMEPVGRTAFDFPVLTYFQERARERVPYITLFPIGGRMRVNLFAYRAAGDPWLRAIRHHPRRDDQCCAAAAAAAHRGIRGAGKVKVRPADLCQRRLSPWRPGAGR